MRTVLVGALVAAFFATAAGATPTPRLSLAHTTPITIAGTGFPHRVAVTVSVRAGTIRRTRVVHTTTTGRFSASFTPLPTYLACRALPVIATARAAATVVVLRFTTPGSSRDCAPKQPVNS